MNLFPQDLGEKRSRFLASRRAGWAAAPAESAAPPIGFWGRRWLGRQKGQMSAEEAQATLRAVRTPTRAWSTLGLLAIPPALALALSIHDPAFCLLDLGLLGGWTWLFTVAQPRQLVARKHGQMYERPVTPGEIAALLPQAHDELERSYLTLVMDVVRQEVAGAQEEGPASGTDLRSALRALGEAIDKLPATRAVGHLSLGSETPDIMTEVLRRTAAETLIQAQAEPDRVGPRR